MSDASNYTERLTLQEQVVRIDRMIAETQKSQIEGSKLQSESNKLQAEGRKFDRDRFLAQLLAVVGIIGGLVAIATLLLHAAGH